MKSVISSPGGSRAFLPESGKANTDNELKLSLVETVPMGIKSENSAFARPNVKTGKAGFSQIDPQDFKTPKRKATKAINVTALEAKRFRSEFLKSDIAEVTIDWNAPPPGASDAATGGNDDSPTGVIGLDGILRFVDVDS